MTGTIGKRIRDTKKSGNKKSNVKGLKEKMCGFVETSCSHEGTLYKK